MEDVETVSERHVHVMMEVLLEALQVMSLVMMMKVKDVLMMKVMKVKEFVVEALLLVSLSSTPTPTTNLRTRPAARV